MLSQSHIAALNDGCTDLVHVTYPSHTGPPSLKDGALDHIDAVAICNLFEPLPLLLASPVA